MTLFVDESLETPPKRRRTWIGWLLLIVAIAGVVAIGFQPSPYVVELPGPVFDTLGEVTVDGKQVPMIEITDEKTYPTKGTLDMLTVSIDGSRENPMNWVDTAVAWLDPSKAVVPIEQVYPEGQTVQQSNEQSAIDMQNSQKDAIAAAERYLGYEVPATITVQSVVGDEPADGVLEKGDVITAVNGERPDDVDALRAAISDNGTSKALELSITRDGHAKTVSITPTLYQDTAVIGVILAVDYEYPVDVTIQLDNIGGPSAGQMFALGIIDKLTPGSLAGGAKVAGTGTIDSAGEIGAIGGIRQKLYGAQRAGAEYFLAPESNCDEVVGHVPAGLTVFAVGTLDDSVADLKVLAAGGDTSALATCR